MSIDPPLPNRNRPSGARPRFSSGKPKSSHPPEKKDKRLYWIGGGLTAFLLLLTFPFLFMTQDSPPPQRTTATMPSPAPAIVSTQPPQALTAVSIAPDTAFPGDRLSVVPYPAIEFLPGRFAVQWFRNDLAVDGATDLTIETGAFTRNDTISVVVTQWVDHSENRSVRSLPVTLRNRSPVIAAGSFGTVEDGVYINEVQASDPDGDPLTFSLLEAPADMTIDADSGIITWPLPAAAGGDYVFQIVASDGMGAALRQLKISLGAAP